MEKRLTREKYDGNNSIYSLNAKYVSEVRDVEYITRKYVYDISENKMTVLGDCAEIDVTYE